MNISREAIAVLVCAAAAWTQVGCSEEKKAQAVPTAAPTPTPSPTPPPAPKEEKPKRPAKIDTEVLANRMRAHGICPSWHYHLIDVEALAIGYLPHQIPSRARVYSKPRDQPD